MKVQTYVKILASISVATMLVYYVIQVPGLLHGQRPVGMTPSVNPPAASINLKTVLQRRRKNSGLSYINLKLGSQGYRKEPGLYRDRYQAGLDEWNMNAWKGVLDHPVKTYAYSDHRKWQRMGLKYLVSVRPTALAKAKLHKSSTKKIQPNSAKILQKKLKHRIVEPEAVRKEIPIDTLLALEGQRLGLNLSFVKSGQLPEDSKCPKDAVLTINPGGRMGNKLCRYLTLWTLARRIPNALVRILPPMEEKLNYYFSGERQLKTLSDNCSSAISWQHLRLGKNGSFPQHLARGESILIDGGPCPLSWLYPRRDDILAELNWRPNITREVQRRLALVPPGTETVVSVHVRRGDYSGWIKKQLNGRLVSPSYLHCALKLARKRYRRPAFLVTSDDMVWTRRNIVANDDVMFVGSNASEAADMATLASCNHSIVTYGTFGYVSAFLAGGDVLVPTEFSQREYPLPAQLEAAGVRVTRLPDTVNC